MNLSDALTKARTTLNRPKCSVALMLNEITVKQDSKEAAKVAAILKDPQRMTSALAEVLRANGYPISAHTLRRHRKGECSC